MKKIIALLFILFYTASISGVTLYAHYCCGKFESINFSKHFSTSCKVESKSSSCCNNKLVVVQVKDNHQKVSLDEVGNLKPIFLDNHFISINSFNLFSYKNNHYLELNSPSNSKHKSSLSFLQVFKI